jgi:hypothetical protein
MLCAQHADAIAAAICRLAHASPLSAHRQASRPGSSALQACWRCWWTSTHLRSWCPSARCSSSSWCQPVCYRSADQHTRCRTHKRLLASASTFGAVQCRFTPVALQRRYYEPGSKSVWPLFSRFIATTVFSIGERVAIHVHQVTEVTAQAGTTYSSLLMSDPSVDYTTCVWLQPSRCHSGCVAPWH